MARTAGRNSDETKTAILTAAARLIGRHGTAVPIAEIAAAAEVSKGGLLYHFPHKEALLTGVATMMMDHFRHTVEHAAAAEPAGTPGRLTRAYVQASFAQSDEIGEMRDLIALAAHLMFEPGAEELAQHDARRWRELLYADGVDPATTRLVITACDGSNTGPLWGAILDDSERHALKADLLTLIGPAAPPLGD